MKINLKNFEYKLLCLLLIYIPFHYYICELFLRGTNIDNVIRDVVIGILLIISLRKKIKLKHGFVVGLGICILCLYAFFSYLFYSYPGTFNILRTYVIPIFIFYVSAKIELSEMQFVTIHRIIYFGLAIIAVYGFFQAFILGDDFIISLGYPQNEGYLAGSSYYIGGFFGYQRVVGTFISPNVCGVILAIGLAALIFNNIIQEKRKKILIFGLVLGLLGTFSRSAILAFLISYLFAWLINRKKIKFRPRKVFVAIGAVIIGILVLYFVDKYALNHLFSRMLQSSFSGLLNSTDTSAQKHWEDLWQPLDNVLKNPFGRGFGNNGPMAVSYSNMANTVESSFYLMCYEVGIIGAIICFIPYFAVIIDTVKNRKNKYFAPACVSIICLFTYILLPNIQTYEIIFYFYLFMGLYYNRSVKKIFVQ